MGRKKLTPCSLYKTEMLECWLDKMAEEGFLLEHEGFKNTYAKFTEAEKQKTYHRIWPKDSFNAYRDANELRKSYGFEFVASSFDFDIYRAADAEALKIYSDKGNDAYAGKAANRRIVFRIIEILILLILFILVLFLIPFILVADKLGILMCLIAISFFIGNLIKNIKSIRMLNKQKKRNGNNSAAENTDWKKATIRHQIPNITRIVVLCILFVLLILAETDSPVRTSIPDDRSGIPFATVIDFTEDKASYQNGKKIINYYEAWETPVAKCNYDWNERAKIRTDDGYEINYSLTVDYHETAHPLLAKALARCYITEAKTTPYAFSSSGDSPSFGFDYEAMYYSDAGDKNYIFQQGNRIIHFSIGCIYEIPENFDINAFDEKCLETIAESFKE